MAQWPRLLHGMSNVVTASHMWLFKWKCIKIKYN